MADSRTTFDVWQLIIYDEQLSRALLDGSYRDVATQRGFTGEQIAVLDWFAAQPGMRWNVENLRFRAALETAACLAIHLPATSRLLCRGDDDWLQDTCYEYLSYYRWDALGHRRLTECERFGAYVRERIVRRRRMPAHIEHVLELELAVVDVWKQTASVPWPEPGTFDPLARPLRAGAQRVLEQPIDLRAFMRDGRALEVAPGPGPVTWFIYLTRPGTRHKLSVIGEGTRELLARCTGERAADEIAREMEDDFELPHEQVLQQLAAWREQGVIV